MTVPSRPSFGSGWIGLRFTRDRGGAPQRRGPRGSEERWAWLFIAPMVVGLAFLSAGPDPGHVRHQPHQLGPAAGAGLGRARQLHPAAGRPRVRDGAPQHDVLHARVGAAGDGPVARPRARAQPGAPGHLVDPDHVLPAAGHLGDRGGPRVGLDLQPHHRPPQPVPQRVRHPGPEVGERPLLGDAVDHRDVDLAGPRPPTRSSSSRGSRRSRPTTTTRRASTARVAAGGSATSRCRCSRRACSSPAS